MIHVIKLTIKEFVVIFFDSFEIIKNCANIIVKITNNQPRNGSWIACLILMLPLNFPSEFFQSSWLETSLKIS